MTLKRCCAALMLSALAACASPPIDLAATPQSDEQFRVEIVRLLESDPMTLPSVIEVEVQDGAVTLRGIVHAEYAKFRAVEIAEAVEGVTGVADRTVVSEDDARYRGNEVQLDSLPDGKSKDTRMLKIYDTGGAEIYQP
jgi:hypothetical protein